MPMPTGGAWPPPAHQPAYTSYRRWDAWYVGDPTGLVDVYGQESTAPSQRIRPGQLAGGVVGMLSRWMWGNAPRRDQRDTRLHVPAPADLAAASAGLLFSEPPALTAAGKDTQAAIEAIVDGGLNTVLRHGAEIGSVLGDVYLRPVIDRDVAPNRAISTAVPADAAIPVIRWGDLVEVTLWSTLHDDRSVVLRLLEHHDVVKGAGRITYSLHQGTQQDLGRAIPLTEHPDAAYLADLVDAGGAQATGLTQLDVVRIPNAGPQRAWRKLGPLKYHGRSDMDGNEPLFDRIDETWTGWMGDVRNARGRITVPSWMLESRGTGLGANWDADREVYSAITAQPNDQGSPQLTVTQFAIRHVEHKATIDALMEAAMRHAGLSSQTLGEEGDIAMTATESQARERQSFVTRGDRINTWAPKLADYVELHLAVEAIHFNGPAPERPSVAFADSVSESPEAHARTIQLLHAAEAISIETKVRMRSPDLDDIQVGKEVERIRIDFGHAVENPDTFTGSPPPGGQPPGEPANPDDPSPPA